MSDPQPTPVRPKPPSSPSFLDEPPGTTAEHLRALFSDMDAPILAAIERQGTDHDAIYRIIEACNAHPEQIFRAAGLDPSAPEYREHRKGFMRAYLDAKTRARKSSRR